jgi:hypothetical protein
MSGELTLKVTVCANGETFEYRLFVGTTQVGPSVFRLGADQHLSALRYILGGGDA